MGWFLRDDQVSSTVDDEAGVGLISLESESAAAHFSEKRRSRISKFSLSVALVLSNIVWSGICVMLWRELREPSGSARIGFDRFEADFGTCISKTDCFNERWC
jgi:hypothetical protein